MRRHTSLVLHRLLLSGFALGLSVMLGAQTGRASRKGCGHSGQGRHPPGARHKSRRLRPSQRDLATYQPKSVWAKSIQADASIS